MTNPAEVLAQVLSDIYPDAFDIPEAYAEDVNSILAALDAAGYQIVPKEPDEEMIEVAKNIRNSCPEGTPPGVVFARAYRAMLAQAAIMLGL